MRVGWSEQVAVLLLLLTCSTASSGDLGVTLQDDNPYSNLIVKVNQDLEECSIILDNFRYILEAASRQLNNATNGKLFFQKVTFLLPQTLLESCRPMGGKVPLVKTVPEVKVQLGHDHPVFGGQPWTQQTLGCGQPAHFIHLPYTFLRADSFSSPYLIRGKRVVQEWAKLRWGVFSEQGVAGDEVFPLAYATVAARLHNTSDWLPNYCVDRDLYGEFRDPCDLPDCPFILEDDQDASTSLLALYTVDSVTGFCDNTTHERLTPTKHNAQCSGRSIMEVLLDHHDFQRQPVSRDDFSITLDYVQYSTQPLAQYLILMDASHSGDYNTLQGRWSLERAAVQQWVMMDVLTTSSLGIVTFAEYTHLVHNMTVVTDQSREDIVNSLSQSYLDSSRDKNITYAIHTASSYMGSEGGTIILIVNPDNVMDSADAMVMAAQTSEVWPVLYTVTTLPPPHITLFKDVADRTGGRVLVVPDDPITQSGEVQQSVTVQHRLVQHLRTVQDHALRYTSYTPTLQVGQEQLSSDVSTIDIFLTNSTHTASLYLYTHTRPQHLTINSRPVFTSEVTNTSFLVLLQDLQPGHNSIEVGGLSSEVEPTTPVEVLVERSADDPEVELRTSHDLTSLNLADPHHPVTLLVKVTRKQMPVVGAKVVVSLLEGSNKFDLHLYDNGGGSPDVTGGDGVYSRYWVLAPSGVNTYTLVVKVSSTPSSKVVGRINNNNTDLECCGSSLLLDHLPAEDFTGTFVYVIGSAVVVSEPGQVDVFPPARVTDLRGHAANDLVTLTFTAPGDDLDRGYALEYRVFWSDDGAVWWEVEASIYSVVEGGMEAQVQVMPPRCGDLVYYRVRARDTRLQEGAESNLAAVITSCGFTSTLPPTEAPLDHCPSTVAAICGAFFGGLASGLVLAAFIYFLYFTYSNRDVGSGDVIHHQAINRSQASAAAIYENAAFTTNDSRSVQNTYTATPTTLASKNPINAARTPNQNRSLPPIPLRKPVPKERQLPIKPSVEITKTAAGQSGPQRPKKLTRLPGNTTTPEVTQECSGYEENEDTVSQSSEQIYDTAYS